LAQAKTYHQIPGLGVLRYQQTAVSANKLQFKNIISPHQHEQQQNSSLTFTSLSQNLPSTTFPSLSVLHALMKSEPLA
jgi:hypothetical protein